LVRRISLTATWEQKRPKRGINTALDLAKSSHPAGTTARRRVFWIVDNGSLPPRKGPDRGELRTQPRALDQAERDTVRALLNRPDFVDKAPATVYHELLDESTYVASVSSMYRVLRAHGEVKKRRRQAVHPARVKPELVATQPNRIWSWDITKLHGPVKWSYFYLYVIIDIYSRYTVGWMIAERESAVLAEQLFADTIAKQGIDRDTLSIHADNGSSMASKPVAFLLADLGVTKSHSRPHTSNDNPYSESQ
jgi:putative transposase